MRFLIISILFILPSYIFSQDTLPVKDTTRWTEFRDDYYNPNIEIIKAKFDSIYESFNFRMDSIIAKKLFIIDSIRFSTESEILRGSIPIDNIVWDTIRYMDGTKQWTAFTP